jgi:hypothetical protein
VNGAHIADQVLTASTALAGLLLVVLGAVTSSYESYSPQFRPDVRGRFLRRGWFAFAGFAVSLLSALSALAYYWHESTYLIGASAALLVLGLIIALLAALISVMDIR